MNSRKKCREIFEYILSLEERACALYESGLIHLKDPEMVREIQSIRDEEARHIQIAEELLSILKKYEAADSKVSGAQPKIWATWRYLAAGILLGLGAPAAALFLRLFFSYPARIMESVRMELEAHSWFYAYMTVGTVTAFFLAPLSWHGFISG
ncbi:MAG: hypothetical protein L0Z48_09125 [candidate division Zixibacteria bacterium]|nr:hypothetical protein [candidate division Zixibacteria bacterium]